MIKSEVIYGPPGTGKSRRLIEMVGAYVNHPKSGNALLCSYTNTAARTLVERWSQPELIESGKLKVSTLHSFCFSQLKLTRMQVVDEAKMLEFLGDFGLDLEEGSEGVRYMELISYAGAMGISPMEAHERARNAPGTRSHFESLVKSYLAWKNTFGYVDYNDMLERYLTFRTAPAIRMLVIDEAQDLSGLQWKVVHRVCELVPNLRIVIAGDDDQSLFAYAGTDPHGMAHFQATYGSRQVVLDQSHRIPRAVHGLAQQIIGRVERRVPKDYKPQDREGKVVRWGGIQQIADNVRSEEDTLIIYSDRFVRMDIEDHLKANATPYVAFAGLPAPLQTRGATALIRARQERLEDEDWQAIRRGLSKEGIALWDRDRHEVIRRLRQRDLNLIQVHWSNESYLQKVALEPNPKIRIATIHGAKGAEADVVHLATGLSTGAVDHSFEDPDAPHRLFYVGVTRARYELNIYEGDNAYDIP